MYLDNLSIGLNRQTATSPFMTTHGKSSRSSLSTIRTGIRTIVTETATLTGTDHPDTTTQTDASISGTTSSTTSIYTPIGSMNNDTDIFPPEGETITDDVTQPTTDGDEESNVLPLLEHLNTAPVEVIARFRTISHVRATNLVLYRDQSGPFATLWDIENVSGIGRKTITKIIEEYRKNGHKLPDPWAESGVSNMKFKLDKAVISPLYAVSEVDYKLRF